MSPGDDQGSRRDTAIGVIALLGLLASLLIGILGAFLHWQASKSKGGGPTGGLSAFPAIGGMGLMVLAVVMFVVCGVLYVRSAKD